MMQRHTWAWCTVILLSAMALDLLLLAVCHADANVYTTQVPQQGGIKGLVIDRPANEPYAAGMLWEQSGVPAWATGLDITQDYPGTPDLVLAYNPATFSDELRISTNGRLILGPRIGHPVWNAGLTIWPGVGDGGMVLGTTGWAHNLILLNENNNVSERDTINWGGLFCLQTARNPGDRDFYLWNWNTNSMVFHVGADNGFRLDAPTEGFFSAPPVPQPTVTGSWSDGSAAKSLLAALVHLGLIKDGTTN